MECLIRELWDSVLWGRNDVSDIIHYEAFGYLIALANLAVIYWGLKYTYKKVKSELRERKCDMAAGFNPRKDYGSASGESEIPCGPGQPAE
jgi:hypothetical protein